MISCIQRTVKFGTLVICVLGTSHVAAQSASSRSWDGFYLGADLGQTHVSSSMRTTVTNGGTYFFGTDPQQLGMMGASDPTKNRLSPSIRSGYVWQQGALLIGVDVSLGGKVADLQHFSSERIRTSPANTFALSQKITADWSLNLRPKIGWAFDKWMTYITGGISLTRLKSDFSYTDDAFSGNSRSSVSKTKVGHVLGAGAEYALDEKWSIRGEYLYTNYGSINSASTVFQTYTTTARPVFAHHYDLKVQTIQIGLSYRF